MIQPKKHIYSLDILRFLAAWTILYGHYIHFYLHYDLDQVGFFFSLLNPYGSLAVPLFFMISGAVFMHIYFDALRINVIGIKYFTRRFSRLYPLHIATFILVLVAQSLIFLLGNHYFIYEYNDFWHAFLNIFFIQSWGLEESNSFNGPTWSVSTEVFCYIVFFFIVSKVFNHFNRVGLFFIAFLIFIELLRDLIGYNLLLRSLFAFLLGCFVYHCHVSGNNRKNLLIYTLLVFSTLFLLNNIIVKNGIPFGWVGPLIIYISLKIDFVFNLANARIKAFIISLGNLTYSSYLMHFPIQLFFYICSEFVFELDFSSEIVLLSYVLITLFLSWVVFRFYEMPMRIKINRFSDSFFK